MIRRATENDIAAIEEILLDAVTWMDENGLHLWERENVRWTNLARFFRPEDFALAFVDDKPAACLALVDHDPHIWPEIEKGQSLFLHKLAVRRAHKGQGLSKQLIEYAKTQAIEFGIKELRLDACADREKVRAMYEREGFVCVGEKILFGCFRTTFYLYQL